MAIHKLVSSNQFIFRLTEIQSLRVSSQAENDQHAQEKQTLIAKKDSLDKEKVDLMNEISAEKELIFKLQEISQRNRVSQISANEEVLAVLIFSLKRIECIQIITLQKFIL